MKYFNIWIFSVLIAFFGNAQDLKKDNTNRQLKLVWSDEFNYSGLPDSSKWSYEVGLLRGTEKQFYTYKRRQNAYVSKGSLIIKAKKEKFLNPDRNKYKGQKYPTKYLNISADSIPGWVRGRYDSIVNYTSASITTLHKESWTYGRFEVRAKLPVGDGTWPIIWMMGTNRELVQWPDCGEIDIMEYIGRVPNTIQANVHYGNQISKKHFSDEKKIIVPKLTNDFHVYSVEWSADRIVFYIDEKMYHSFSYTDIPTSIENPFHKPFYLLINLALGGSYGGKLDDKILPQSLLIDYVRIYQ